MSAPEAIDVLAQPCPTASVRTRLPLALIEQVDRARGNVPRSAYLALVIDAAMTRERPVMPEGAGDGDDWIDALARRKYAQHVRSIELRRERGR